MVLLLSGCAGGPIVLNRAQLPVPEIEPLPSFPEPSHTPAGAGASPLGVPWNEPPALVERSPNKRLLPVDPTDPAPGLWAADAVQGSTKKYPTIADVEVPLPESDDSNLEGRECADKIERLLKSEGQMPALMNLSLKDRRCVAAQLFEFCWQEELKGAKTPQRRGRMEGGVDEIRHYVAYSCMHMLREKPRTEKIKDEVTRAWALTGGLRKK